VADGSDDIAADELQRTEDEKENDAEGDLAARAVQREVTNGTTGTDGDTAAGERQRVEDELTAENGGEGNTDVDEEQRGEPAAGGEATVSTASIGSDSDDAFEVTIVEAEQQQLGSSVPSTRRFTSSDVRRAWRNKASRRGTVVLLSSRDTLLPTYAPRTAFSC